MKTLLKKIKARVKKYGHAQVSKDLGYHSSNAVRHWIDNQRIPKFKIEQVREYLKNASNNG